MTAFIKRPADRLHYLPASEYHPANTYFHFSFANYHDPDNIHYGVLRVVNDDDVKPHSGFDRHPHRDMEIVSYLLHGKLTHWDSVTREEEVLERGHIQAITAGTGLTHSELNRHDEWTRFLQIWILPPAQGLAIRYGSAKPAASERENRLLHLVSPLDGGTATPLHLNQDVNFHVTELTRPDAEVVFELAEGRQAYVSCMEGSLVLVGMTDLAERDSLEVTGPASLRLSAPQGHGHAIIIEMPRMDERYRG
ncbi:MAG: pirin family protein [Aeromonas sp.]|uniref:pirin family protein n=1 Tax=Aeromonas sp. TaxID=647 RepID=UPI003F30DDD0